MPRVDILMAYADMPPDLINAAVADGAKGIVIAGVGNGNMNKVARDAAEAAAKKGVIVVRASRVPTGIVAGTWNSTTTISASWHPKSSIRRSRASCTRSRCSYQRSPQDVQKLFDTY
jgi:L-asparaginase/Glu-tRNA(Gln) amidotransferase subunit D